MNFYTKYPNKGFFKYCEIDTHCPSALTFSKFIICKFWACAPLSVPTPPSATITMTCNTSTAVSVRNCQAVGYCRISLTETNICECRYSVSYQLNCVYCLEIIIKSIRVVKGTLNWQICQKVLCDKIDKTQTLVRL